MKKRIHLVAGARPNSMKVGPLFHALSGTEWAEPVLAQREDAVVDPLHPRTCDRLSAYQLGPSIERAGVRLLPPLGYLEFMSLVKGSAAVSGIVAAARAAVGSGRRAVAIPMCDGKAALRIGASLHKRIHRAG